MVLLNVSFTYLLLCLPSSTAFHGCRNMSCPTFSEWGERGREREVGVAKQDRGQREGRGKEKDSGSISDLYESCSAWPDEMPEGSSTLLHFAKHLDIHKL